MQARILIIEDIREMSELMSAYLQKDGLSTEVCDNAEDALSRISVQQDFPYDLIILDINLPGMDGFEFLQVLRKTSQVPVVIVSAREADEDIVMGLGIGADEFVTKPFSPKVLVARVRAHLRRQHESSQRSGREGRRLFRFGPFIFDPEGYLLRKEDQRISLSSREVEVLAFLISNSGKAFTPQAIYSAVWKNQYGDITTVAVYIQRLRRKMEDDPGDPHYIQTVYGMGYRFNAEALQTAVPHGGGV